MKEKILRQIKSHLQYMSTAEQKIAKTILKDPHAVIASSLGDFAARAAVSQGSVVNFSTKFCGGGFPVLKMAIATALSAECEKPFSSLESNDSMSEIFQKTAQDIYEAFQNTGAQNGSDTLKTVCKCILSAKKIEIYGIFRSAVIANDFYFQLIQLGIPATFVSDVLTCAISASMLERDHLVIAISSSGQTQDIIDAVQLAKKNGVPVVSITAHKSSPLAKLSDHVLIASPSGNSLSASSSEIRFSQLAITEALCSYLRNRIDADGTNHYFKMNEILNSHNVKD